MPRVKGGTIHRARRAKIMKAAKGYFGSKHRLYRTAKEQVMHSLKYAYRDRRQKKRDFRKLWIIRINAACRLNNISYSKFMNGLKKSGITVNRKMLSEIAIDNPTAFSDFVKLANEQLNGKTVKEEVSKKEEKIVETKTTVKKEVASKETEDISKMTVAELRKIAKEKNIADFSTMKKAELLEALK